MDFSSHIRANMKKYPRLLQKLKAIKRAASPEQPFSDKLVEANKRLKHHSQSIAAVAREHLQISRLRQYPSELLPSSFWTIILARFADELPKLTTAEAALVYLTDAFTINMAAETTHGCLPVYKYTLKGEFPHFDGLIDQVECSPYLTPDRLVSSNGKLVSSAFFAHLRSLLCCLTWIDRPSTVCEIGGGYGGLAVLWMNNPHHAPDVYVLVDFPESLFFAEIFVRANDPEAKVLYVKGADDLSPNVVEEYDYVLCPSDCAVHLHRMHFDVVVNMFSFQEMTEQAVDYWMNWLDDQNCQYLYSLNIFGLSLSQMRSVLPGCALWSPRLSDRWIARLQNVSAGPMHAHGQPVAEMIFEKINPLSQKTKGPFKTREAFVAELYEIQREPNQERVLEFVRSWAFADAPPREILAIFNGVLARTDENFKREHAGIITSLNDRLRY